MQQQIPPKSNLSGTDGVNLAKITAPWAGGILPRKRLFALLDKYNSVPVTWITAPAGSGKTSLVTSYLANRKSTFLWYQCDSGDRDIASFFYCLGLAAKKLLKIGDASLPLLTPEYLQDIRKFAHNYFEKLYHLLAPGSFIIFDNFQEVASDSLLIELLGKVSEHVPHGMRIVFISRSGPPLPMARALFYNQLIQINGDDISLTPQEIEEFVAHYIEGEIAPELIASLYTRSHGWMAGVILIINQKKGKGILEADVDIAGKEILFDYFAGEIFQAESPEVKQFLIATAFLPEFTEEMAREISGNTGAKDILRRMLHNNFFITSHSGHTFQYHPLFQEFLTSRAKQALSVGVLDSCRRKSAELLADNNKIEEAANLYATVKDYPSLIGIICREGANLMQRGQAQTLHSWIDQIPETLQQEHPWVIYWRGMCHLPFNLSAAKSQLEQAYAAFQDNYDIPGTYAAWCGITESILHALQDLSELDHWIITLDQLLAENKNAVPALLENRLAAAMFMSQVLRWPDHPRFSYWKEKALTVLAQDSNISLRIFTGFYLLAYSYWTGDLGMADKVLGEIRAMTDSSDAQPLARIIGYFSVSWHGWMEGDYKAALTAVKRGLRLSAKTGVVIWDHMMTMQGAVNCLSEGDADGADPWLDKLAENLPQARAFDIFYYHHERAWQALIRGKPQEAFAHQQSALANIERSGAKPVIGAAHYGMALVCHELEKYDQRDHHLEACSLHGEQCRSRLLFFMARLAEAQYALEDGDNECASELLQRAMTVGREEGYYNFTFWHAPVIIPILLFCLEKEIEVEYVQKLIRKRNLRPTQPPVHLASWPWPLRIYTFGRFSVLKNGTPLAFGKKASIKVQELLKALIASGGRDVNEGRLSDFLWPDSDGDAAKQALATTLFRLRKWLGIKDAIIRSEGLISLAPHSCWVDAWAVERLLGEADQAEHIDSNRILQVAAMYSGHFLAQDADKPWSTLMRERLRGKMIRAISAAAENCGRAHQYTQSISCYQKGIELDPLAEELYQGLMQNYAAMGETVNVLRTYDQLKTVLSATFDIAPSQSSQALYRTLISHKN